MSWGNTNQGGGNQMGMNQMGMMQNQMGMGMGVGMGMGGMQQQIFEKPDLIKTIQIQGNYCLTVDVDPTSGIVACGTDAIRQSSGWLFQFQSGKLIQKIPEIEGSSFIRLIAPNTYCIICNNLRDQILIINPNLQGGSPNIKQIEHGLSGQGHSYDERIIEPLGNGNIVVGIGRTIIIVDPTKGEVVSKFTKDKGDRVRALVVLPNGNFISSHSKWYEGTTKERYVEQDGDIFFYNLQMGTSKKFNPSMVANSRTTFDGVRGLAYSSDRNQLVSGCGDYNHELQIWVWQLPQNTVVGKMNMKWPLKAGIRDKCIALNCIGVVGKYVVAGVQNSLKIFSLDTFELVHTMPDVHGSGGAVRCIRPRLDQGFLITGGKADVKFWEVPESWKSAPVQQQMVTQQQLPQQQQQGGMQNQPQACQNCEKYKKEIEVLKLKIQQLEKMQTMGGMNQQQGGNQMQMGNMMGNQNMMGGNMMNPNMMGNQNQMMGGRNNMMMGNQMMGNQMMGNQMMGRGNMMGNQWKK